MLLRATFLPRTNWPSVTLTAFFFFFAIMFGYGMGGAATTPRWAMLSVFLPLWLMFQQERMVWTAGHVVGAAFLTYATLSMSWVTVPIQSVDVLWKYWLLGAAFVIGSRTDNPRPIYAGLGLGFCVNSAFVIALYFYVWRGIVQIDAPSSSFIKRNYLNR